MEKAKVKVTLELHPVKDLSEREIEKRIQDMIANVEWEDIPVMKVINLEKEYYTITKKRFLDWYLDDGEGTQESESIKNDLVEIVIKDLISKGSSTLTVEDLFENCNKDAIRLSYLNEFSTSDENYDIEFGSRLRKNITLKLID